MEAHMAKETEYTCPMHPQIRQKKPGPCPICGMELEPVYPTDSADDQELKNLSIRFWIALILRSLKFFLCFSRIKHLSLN